ncbi:hypothetical protein NW754_004562 [Fusarium falciforme]|nr:hypothetical protein NW754_004562 [Fusarium falciforme]
MLSSVDFADCDQQLAAKAIVKGLSQREDMGTVIHTSGAKIIAWETEAQPLKWVKDVPKPYNDWDGADELISIPSSDNIDPSGYAHVLPNWAAHRNVDKAILRAFRDSAVNVQTAIVCPPTIFGSS